MSWRWRTWKDILQFQGISNVFNVIRIENFEKMFLVLLWFNWIERVELYKIKYVENFRKVFYFKS